MRVRITWFVLAASCGPVVDPPASADATSVGDDAADAPSVDPAESSTDDGSRPGEGGSAIGESSSDADEPGSTAAPDDAWSDCPFADGVAVVDPQAAYPFCQPDVPTAYELYCAPYDLGHGYWNWHADTDGVTSSYCEEQSDCNACLCSVSCRNDPDDFVACSDPPSGNAMPTCFTWNGPDSDGQCLLDCGNGETCPDGMQCVDNLEAGMRVCAWMTQGDRCERP